MIWGNFSRKGAKTQVQQYPLPGLGFATIASAISISIAQALQRQIFTLLPFKAQCMTGPVFTGW